MARRLEGERFWEKVRKSDGCWIWTAGTDRQGYGTFRLTDGPMVKAHRWAWMSEFGEPPAGTELDHLCRVRSCVRPSHLEPVVHAENMRRARREFCDHGHPMQMYGGEWCCRTCTRRRLNEWQQEKRRAAGAVPGGPGAAQRAKTHCLRGHEFTADNTVIDRHGHRSCRECARIRRANRGH